MSALTRKGSRGLFLDLFELLDPLDVLHLWFGGLAMRIEDGIQNGRYMVRAEMPGIDPQRQADYFIESGPREFPRLCRGERHRRHPASGEAGWV